MSGRPWVGAMAAGILLAVSGCDLANRFGSKETAFVMPSVLNLRESPSTAARVVRRLNRGEELAVLERKDGWNRVRTAAGEVTGWVHGDFVGTAEDVRAKFQAEVKRRRSTRRVARAPEPAVSEAPAADPGGNADGGLTVSGLLRGFPEAMAVEEIDALDGVPRAMGVTNEGQVVAEFWGAPERLDRASLMVTVLHIGDEELEQNAALALRFAQNGLPSLHRGTAWMIDRLRLLSSKDTGEGEMKAGGRRLAFGFLKAMGAVRITVEKSE